ncbi:MAG: hypothetical protein ACFFEM_16485 [Candidatus Thorarchaeota archaeon]
MAGSLISMTSSATARLETRNPERLPGLREEEGRAGLRARRLLGGLCLVAVSLVVFGASGRIARGDRLDMPVVVTGHQLTLWASRPIGEVYAFVYEATSGTWATIPYQIDERVWVELATCLNDPSYGNVDQHLSYVFSGTEGNGLDDDDEIVLLAGDAAGDQAPVTAWPSGTQDVRYQLRIDDGLGATLGYAYLFTATAPPAPPDPTDYVQLSFVPIDATLEDTTIATDRYSAHYSGRWRLDQLAIPPTGGGSGADMIDRLKFREATSANATGGETEETWDQFSCFLGQKDGPVRVIREIQGAASGVNTTHTVSLYESLFDDRVNLRVHAIPNVVSFVDYNASITTTSALTYYNPTNGSGVTIDGQPDPGMDLTLNNWEMVSHPAVGALFFHRAEPIPVPAQSRSMFFFEDDDFVDTTGDDEPGRYGCHGVFMSQIASTDEPGDEAVLVLTTRPLPAATGNQGATLASEVGNPPFAVAAAQTRAAAVPALVPTGVVALMGALLTTGMAGLVRQHGGRRGTHESFASRGYRSAP